LAQVACRTSLKVHCAVLHSYPTKMASQWFSCKGACTGSDKVSDTVKVDVSKLASDKENVQPVQIQNKTDEARKARENEKKAQEELIRQQQKEAAQRLQAEEEAKRRRQEEDAERQRAEQAAAEAAAEREAFAAAAAEAAERAEEQLRLEAAQEQERREREAAIVEAQKQERERAAEKVNIWCKANGFSDMNSKKKSFMSGSKFPLHEAVAKNNELMVHLMVYLGADRSLKNSKGQTAEDLATKMNKNGSMDDILSQLS